MSYATKIMSTIALPFEKFLNDFCGEHIVECEFLLGEADVSPESANSSKHPNSWAHKLFSCFIDHREFDRAALGLKYLHAIINNDRSSFPISDSSYENIKNFVDSNVVDNNALYAWCWALLFNALGKIKKVVQIFTEKTGRTSSDHDQILVGVLQSCPQVFPTFANLNPTFQQALIDGLNTGFNFGKAAQLECSFVAWKPFQELDVFTANFHFGHSFFDFLGVTGAIKPINAQPFILNDENVLAYFNVARLRDPKVYADSRLALVGMETHNINLAFARLLGMLRIFDTEQAHKLKAVVDCLPTPVYKILNSELQITGTEISTAIEPHYGLALFANAKKADPATGIYNACILLARIFFEVRRKVQENQGMVIANLNKVATKLVQEKDVFDQKIILQKTDDGFLVGLEKNCYPDLDKFPARDLSTLCKDNTAVLIGCGGGSDCLQAYMLGKYSGANTLAVISIRSPRKMENVNEVYPGVYEIFENSTGEDRFLENLIAGKIPTYMVTFTADKNLLKSRINFVLKKHKSHVVVGVDTGGDSLYKSETVDLVTASPDQDRIAVETLKSLSVDSASEFYTAIVALGVDSPPYAEHSLLQAQAKRYVFNKDSIDDILATYRGWISKTKFLGKTPLALCQSLVGNTGLNLLNLPTSLVMKAQDPWCPFLYIDPAMSSVFVMRVQNHYNII